MSFKNGIRYFKKHPAFHGAVHAIGGIGVGILIAGPVAGIHPVRWAGVFIGVAILGHLYAMNN